MSSLPDPCGQKRNKSKSILCLCPICKAIAVPQTNIWVDENSSSNGFNACCARGRTSFALVDRIE